MGDFKKILIVDDSATSRLIIKRCLEMAGYSEAAFYESADGAQALGFLAEQSVDLILSDIKMPKMDGRTFMRKLRLNKSTKDIPIVVVSSVGENASGEDLMKELAMAVIQKPISPLKVAKALGSSGR